jgi:hypothetical protein
VIAIVLAAIFFVLRSKRKTQPAPQQQPIGETKIDPTGAASPSVANSPPPIYSNSPIPPTHGYYSQAQQQPTKPTDHAPYGYSPAPGQPAMYPQDQYGIQPTQAPIVPHSPDPQLGAGYAAQHPHHQSVELPGTSINHGYTAPQNGAYEVPGSSPH